MPFRNKNIVWVTLGLFFYLSLISVPNNGGAHFFSQDPDAYLTQVNPCSSVSTWTAPVRTMMAAPKVSVECLQTADLAPITGIILPQFAISESINNKSPPSGI